jgi:hypothetical protein
LPSPAAAALAISVAIHTQLTGAASPGSTAPLSVWAKRSCDAALGEGRCRLEVPSADGASDSDEPDFEATVVAKDEKLDEARVEIRRRADGPVMVTRDVTFAAEDSTKERWASTGVLIAALVVAEALATPPAPPPAEPKPPPKPKPRPQKPRAEPSTRLRVDVRALGARRLSSGSPELGAALGVSALLPDGHWILGASFAGARRMDDEPAITWGSVTAGLGLRAGAARAVLAAEVTTGAVLEYWSVGATGGGRSENDAELRFGGFLGADALWAVHPKWILSLGVEGRIVTPRFRIDVAGSEADSAPGLGALVYAGVRFAP